MMDKNKTGKLAWWIGNIYKISPIKRSIIIWVVFQITLWVVFGISYINHKEAWTNAIEVESTTAAVGGWFTTLLFIFINNLIICALIIIGNIFVRFNIITPGLIILAIQAVMIGWMAGTNGFEVPFVSVQAANLQYLKIGLWETTSYALACAVTLPKSLNIAETFPAKEWSQTRKLKDISFNTSEKTIVLVSSITLLIAAIIETVSIIG